MLSSSDGYSLISKLMEARVRKLDGVIDVNVLIQLQHLLMKPEINTCGKFCSEKKIDAEDSSQFDVVSSSGDLQQQPRLGSGRYKTELCRPFDEVGECKYGDKCQFAHGVHELRRLPRHPKYKTELCRTFHSNGFCPYGPRCHFIHGEELARSPSVSGQQSPESKRLDGRCGPKMIVSKSVNLALGSKPGLSNSNVVFPSQSVINPENVLMLTKLLAQLQMQDQQLNAKIY